MVIPELETCLIALQTDAHLRGDDPVELDEPHTPRRQRGHDVLGTHRSSFRCEMQRMCVTVSA